MFRNTAQEIMARNFRISTNQTTTGNFIHVSDGGTFHFAAAKCNNFGLGLYVENVGYSPVLDITNLSITNCTQAINIEHPGTQRFFEGRL